MQAVTFDLEKLKTSAALACRLMKVLPRKARFNAV
jgi:hypothetical protein